MRNRARHRRSPRLLPRHRRPPSLLPRVLFTALAAVALAAGFLPGLLSASAAPARPAAAARPALITDRVLIARAAAASRAAAAAQATRLAAVRGAAMAAEAIARTYTVRAGDTLSAVAARRCGHPDNWTGIYAASRARGWTTRNANSLSAGQHLWLSCTWVPAMLRYAPAPPPPPPPVVQAVVMAQPSWHGSYSAPVSRSYSAPSSYSGSGGFQSCVIRAESGGNARAVNSSSGAGGLYQFLPSTWNALGYSGLPQDASVATQNAAFQKAYAQSGTAPWAPYDGC